MAHKGPDPRGSSLRSYCDIPAECASICIPSSRGSAGRAPLVSRETPRSGHTGLILENNGKVLFAGGTNAGQLVLGRSGLGAPGSWAPVPDMPSARAGHTAMLLLDGKVLIAGGKDASGLALSTIELFNPATGAYLRVGDLAAPVWGHTATLLQDGTVLIAGGRDGSGQPAASAQLYDPITTLFSTLTMNSPRAGHTATRLADGRVLVAGGSDGSNALAGLEIYDPGSRTFSLVSKSLLAARQSQTATLLGDGRVLLAGGSNASGVLASVEVFNPADGTVAAAGALNVARTLASAARLLDGTVLVAGDQDGAAQDLNSAEIFDPAKNTFAPLSVQMSTARSGHLGLTLENNGKVLIAGGTSAGQLVTTVEVYDPVLGAFWQPASPSVARQLFGANFLLFPYTGILVASGGLDSNNAALASSEAFFYPTIRSDKPDYQPGDTVVLMGERWQPGEPVNVRIVESNGDPDVTVSPTADSSGAFTINAMPVDQSDIAQRFLATASGQASHWTAQTRVTDSGALAYTPSSQSLTANADGAPVSFSFSTGSAPSGADDTKSWTVSFTVPAGTVAGSYTANIKANPSISGVGVGPGTSVTLTVNATVNTPAIVTSSANPSVFGQNLTFTATVAPASGGVAPTGTVQFVIDGSNFGAPVSLSACAPSPDACASISDSALSVGNHTVAANYTHTGSFNDSSGSLASGQAVNKADTSSTLASSANPSVYGQAVTFTATVSVVAPGGGTPTGNVQFFDGATSLGTGALAGTTTTLTTSALSVATHSITAKYLGDANFNWSMSWPLTQAVQYNVCLLYDPTRAVKSGATYPIKLYPCDISNNDVSSSGIILHATGVFLASTQVGAPEDARNANPDSDFRFDSTLGPSGGYIFNLKTSGLGSGTYGLQFTAGTDPVPHTVGFGVK